ncbi:hypothetical protein [Parvibaculum sp.]|uniref:hypothetical protein n=1 Tax=Parvibaculum sp. TaxID=2024848 RepID=UPI001B221138|nr:hypothetical protein [Parvibaculum sp.]MBO6634199.1 hypothetical protein [Parvibaculum sp.]MBO6677454.1 hypothetical protein [Parvibaculum sp.]MBO6685089.1 hypothetical protein [Parvibaculum sp.]MBO6905770.1 hypothetical protein [Parvibaculum sp.]
MNILATYANSYVGVLDVALSARSEQMAGKTREAAREGRLTKLFSLGLRKETAEAA